MDPASHSTRPASATALDFLSNPEARRPMGAPEGEGGGWSQPRPQRHQRFLERHRRAARQRRAGRRAAGSGQRVSGRTRPSLPAGPARPQPCLSDVAPQGGPRPARSLLLFLPAQSPPDSISQVHVLACEILGPGVFEVQNHC